ncbi:hypothetical protein DL96DRAFT_1710212 [Flagelloscypha sp. PMI_526]|nr:hypothetical protein DL96DRAFT_1710212 [Flagelloscypha sp. PMI_526]
MSNSSKRIVIVGGGLAGISTAIALKKQLGFENFTIYEKSASVGGTWRDNTYPGCGSDIPGHWYSLSHEPNPNWSAYFVSQPEILAYWRGLHQKFDLGRHTIYNTAVHSAKWDEQSSKYTLTLHDGDSDQFRETTEADLVVYAIGGFQQPKFPTDIKGIEAFGGNIFHSARWRHDVQLKGKKIGVIGNGCSAAQLIPTITKDPSVQVINFCRTPQWFVPRGNYRYPSFVKWIFAHIPLVMWFYRISLWFKHDISYLAFHKSSGRLLKLVRTAFTFYMKRTAPKQYLDKLIPTYDPGCKRIIVDPHYLESLHRPNVDIEWSPIEEIVPEGIKLQNGKMVPLDVIIFSTGYSIDPVDLRVTGRNGRIMREYFEEQKGPTCFFGSFVPGFPNAGVLLGPNVAAGHASVIFSEETQINFILKLAKMVIEGKIKSFDVKEETTNRYNTWLQSRLSNSVWTQCTSYYQSATTGKIVATFPGPVTLFWWMMRKVNPTDWNFVPDLASEESKKAR